MEKIEKLEIENVFSIDMRSFKDCQTVQTLYKTRINYQKFMKT